MNKSQETYPSSTLHREPPEGGLVEKLPVEQCVPTVHRE